MRVKSWKEHEPLVEHYKALGQDEVYLSDYDGCVEFPWEHTTKCEASDLHRIDISTSVNFRAVGPSGLKYRWSFDIEPPSANGKGHYEISAGPISVVLGMLVDPVKREFQQYLLDCAEAVEKRAAEFDLEARKQFGTAEQLRRLGRASAQTR